MNKNSGFIFVKNNGYIKNVFKGFKDDNGEDCNVLYFGCKFYIVRGGMFVREVVFEWFLWFIEFCCLDVGVVRDSIVDFEFGLVG